MTMTEPSIRPDGSSSCHRFSCRSQLEVPSRLRLPVQQRRAGRTLVAYFTRTGNTRTIAGLLSRDLQAVLFEIEPATPYPADYFATVEQATQERERSTCRHSKRQLATWGATTQFSLVFPFGGFGASGHTLIPDRPKLCRQPLVPFNLHGGYGLGNSREVIAKASPQALLAKGFVMEG
jgi:hypothetical protein